MSDIMRKLLERDKYFDSKVISALVSSLHDLDGTLIEMLHKKLLD